MITFSYVTNDPERGIFTAKCPQDVALNVAKLLEKSAFVRLYHDTNLIIVAQKTTYINYLQSCVSNLFKENEMKVDKSTFDKQRFITMYNEPFMLVDPVRAIQSSTMVQNALANNSRFAVNMNTGELTILTRARLNEAYSKQASEGKIRVIVKDGEGMSTAYDMDEFLKALSPKMHGFTVTCTATGKCHVVDYVNSTHRQNLVYVTATGKR